jgi:hypothetical protein
LFLAKNSVAAKKTQRAPVKKTGANQKMKTVMGAVLFGAKEVLVIVIVTAIVVYLAVRRRKH